MPDKMRASNGHAGMHALICQSMAVFQQPVWCTAALLERSACHGQLHSICSNSGSLRKTSSSKGIMLGDWAQATEGVKQLGEIVASFEAAFEGTDGATGEAEFAPVLAAVVDPLLIVFERSAEALAPNAPTRSAACALPPL